ncbi:MAG: cytochrome c peroxidase, partial [Pseudomonadota bacterium]
SLGATGKFGGRNSPTVLNAGFQFAQFWDGRAATLEDQAKGPILNPVEMGMPNEKIVLERFNSSADYPALFQKVFPQDPQPVSYDNMAKAIAAFERTLITHDRFDDFLIGDDQALSNRELQGLRLFIKSNCVQCHDGNLLGGHSYEKMGIRNPYANVDDLGRFEVTKKEEDKYRFKVPTLRNIEVTGPYFHDGKVSTLTEAVQQMAWLQSGPQLTQDEVQEIVFFFKSLTNKPRKSQ